MEKKDFPKGTKPREIFVYTCERIAEPLIPLGYKYRKSKNDIYKKDGIFVFSFLLFPLHPLWLHHFYCLLRCEFPGDCPVAQ